MNFLQFLVFLFSTFHFSVPGFVGEEKDAVYNFKNFKPETNNRWIEQSPLHKTFRATEARIAAIRAESAARAAKLEAAEYSALARKATSTLEKMRASKMSEKSRRRASRFEAENREQAIVAAADDAKFKKASFTIGTEWSSHDFLEAARKAEETATFLRLLAEAKIEEEESLEESKSEASKRTLFNRSMIGSGGGGGGGGDDDDIAGGNRSDHDYTYDNVDDYVNENPAYTNKLYYSTFDYDSGSRDQFVHSIEPKDLVHDPKPSKR